MNKSKLLPYNASGTARFDHTVRDSLILDVNAINQLPAYDHRLAFYDLNYSFIFSFMQKLNQRKIFLGPAQDRVCRFCGGRKIDGSVRFGKKAHALPELVGNRTLFTNYECDDCNQLFGDGIESDLGVYLKPYKILAAIRGKNGFPEIKDEKKGWRISREAGNLIITHKSDERIAFLSEDEKTIRIEVPRDPYIPVNVYKAFVKMGLSLIPERKMHLFQDTINWIKGTSNHGFIPPTISSTFIEGPPVPLLSVLLLKRKVDEQPLPYMMMCLLLANTQFHFMVPSLEKDKHLIGKKMTFPSFPTAPELMGEHHRVHYEELDLSGSELLRDDVVKYDFSFDERTLVDGPEVTPPSTP